ncbi:MAG: hypothetical protein KA438_01175 [Aliarcobacter sp.]|jgi:hypothetical protein|nr:hypothetical protein [Aliarcobacter sp.]MBP7225336.1 hypothetical protein [Aliarcobacter sp.]MDX9962095.1 hypothetical protein [Aliarcobacter sp.]
MILIGDKLVPFEDIFLIKNIKDIENTKANSTVLFDFNEEILTYCYKNELFCAVVVNSIKEAIYCNNLNVKYIISEKELSIELQKIADNYMYDSKILAIIDSNEELEQVAKLEIDGIIYRNLLK